MRTSQQHALNPPAACHCFDAWPTCMKMPAGLLPAQEYTESQQLLEELTSLAEHRCARIDTWECSAATVGCMHFCTPCRRVACACGALVKVCVSASILYPGACSAFRSGSCERFLHDWGIHAHGTAPRMRSFQVLTERPALTTLPHGCPAHAHARISLNLQAAAAAAGRLPAGPYELHPAAAAKEHAEAGAPDAAALQQHQAGQQHTSSSHGCC